MQRLRAELQTLRVGLLRAAMRLGLPGNNEQLGQYLGVLERLEKVQAPPPRPRPDVNRATIAEATVCEAQARGSLGKVGGRRAGAGGGAGAGGAGGEGWRHQASSHTPVGAPIHIDYSTAAAAAAAHTHCPSHAAMFNPQERNAAEAPDSLLGIDLRIMVIGMTGTGVLLFPSCLFDCGCSFMNWQMCFSRQGSSFSMHCTSRCHGF